MADEASARECLDAIRLVLASPTYDQQKVAAIVRIVEDPGAPSVDLHGTSSVARLLRALRDPEDEKA